MPRAAPAACSTPMCAGKAIKGTRCPDCTQEAKTAYSQTEERQALNKFYQGKVWRSISKAYRRRYPVCAHCVAAGRATPADMVDHIIPVRVQWELRHDSKNLQALCHPCHNAKTAKDRRHRS
ncbi:HNH endonuclease [SAR92 clade bacterium H921]|nr:HNH endonuclease [SAR92 clade bacterium H921]